MLNVDERLKELYRADSTDKQLILDTKEKKNLTCIFQAVT